MYVADKDIIFYCVGYAVIIGGCITKTPVSPEWIKLFRYKVFSVSICVFLLSLMYITSVVPGLIHKAFLCLVVSYSRLVTSLLMENIHEKVTPQSVVRLLSENTSVFRGMMTKLQNPTRILRKCGNTSQYCGILVTCRMFGRSPVWLVLPTYPLYDLHFCSITCTFLHRFNHLKENGLAKSELQ